MFEPLEADLFPVRELFANDLHLGAHRVLEFRQFGLTALVIDMRDEVGREVDDLLEFLWRHIHQVAETARHTLEEPDVCDRSGQLNVAHPLTTHLGTGDLYAAALTNDPLVADPLVLTAVALPVLLRAKDPLVEETILLRLERAVIDRFGFLHLTVRPGTNLVGSGEADLQFIERLSQHALLRSTWRA